MFTSCRSIRFSFRSTKYATRKCIVLMLLAFCVLLTRQATADPILETKSTTQTYILELSGTVSTKTFNGVTMTLKISTAPIGSINQYQVIAEPRSKVQKRNAFFWNSEQGAMDVVSNTIRCKIKPGTAAASAIHFNYLRPKEFRKRQFTHKEAQDYKQALKNAEPAPVPAQAGELKLTMGPSTVSGTVWLRGYDVVEKSYVRYSASFSGRRSVHLDSKTAQK